MAGLKATVEDVRHAYRLLLGREPDEEGAQTFHRMIAERAPSPPDLARHFLGSQEFVALESIALAEVELGDFIMVVRSDDEAVGQAIRDTRQWEPHVTSELRSRLHEGAAFLDVGANIGYFTALAARLVGPSGRVVAIEPMDKNLQLIYATVERNGFSHVRMEPFAASDGAGIVCMGTHGSSSNGEIVRGAGGGDCVPRRDAWMTCWKASVVSTWSSSTSKVTSRWPGEVSPQRWNGTSPSC